MSIRSTVIPKGTIPPRPLIATVKSGSLTACAISLSTQALPTRVCSTPKPAARTTIRTPSAAPSQRISLRKPPIRPALLFAQSHGMDRDGGGAFLRTEVLSVERDRHQGVELGSRTTL